MNSRRPTAAAAAAAMSSNGPLYVSHCTPFAAQAIMTVVRVTDGPHDYKTLHCSSLLLKKQKAYAHVRQYALTQTGRGSTGLPHKPRWKNQRKPSKTHLASPGPPWVWSVDNNSLQIHPRQCRQVIKRIPAQPTGQKEETKKLRLTCAPLGPVGDHSLQIHPRQCRQEVIQCIPAQPTGHCSIPQTLKQRHLLTP